MAFGNLYEHKHYKKLVIVPILLLIVSLYFIPSIPLDSTLRGGVSIQLQTNGSVNIQQLTSQINSKIPGAQASVSTAPAGIAVTIAANSSLATGQQDLLNMYSLYGNYSTAQADIAEYQSVLKTGQNLTVQSALSSAETNQSAALAAMQTQLAGMLKTLKPFIQNKTFTYNSSNAQAMLNTASAAYSNASNYYQALVVGTLKGIVPFSSYTYQEVTPTLGAYFLGEMQEVIIVAFVIVAIAVFILFRTPIPSLSVVFGAGNDILVALGLMGIFGIPLGVASIGGLLMLIGYAIDTDMLSAIRIIKRGEGTPSERAFSTMKTGITMTIAAIITFSVLLVVSYLAFIPTYYEISAVVLFGLIADIFTTWFGNTVMVLWWKQRKDRAVQ